MRKCSTATRVFLLLGIMLYWLGSPASVWAQGAALKGTVKSDAGEVLPGVNVLIKGSSRGTTTDGDGVFMLDNVKPEDVLTLSFIGYTTQEVTVGNQTTLNVTLATDVETLSEVVVVGYGTQRKIETTGSIASVKSADLVQTPVSNVAQGLQARVAGVQITQNSSAPGGNVSVRIRGTNSINGTSEPLYVVDGIQIANSGNINDVSPLSTINPNDIESIEVLKDASATSIYGARGANGVVLITTKRGKSGSTRVSYEGYYGVQEVRKTLDMMNASQFAQLENEVFKTQVYADPAAEGQGVNWQDLIFRSAPIQNHQLSVNGGSEKTQLALSMNYFNQDGIIINSNFKRYSLRLNIDHKINDRVKMGTSLMGSFNINNGIPTGSQTVGDADVVTGSIVGAALGAPPTLKPYRDDGSLFPFAEQRDGRYREVTNPLGLAAIKNRTDLKRVLVNVYGEAQLLKGLTYRASFNADVQGSINNYYSPRSIIATKDLNATSGSGRKEHRNGLTLLHESILTYTTVLAQDHTLKFTGVFATQTSQNDVNLILGNGFPNDATTNERLELANTVSTSSFKSKERLDSYMGRVNYGYKDKYFFDVTARADGSSKFGANYRYGFFPAASAAWRIIEESFMQNVTFISDLKLRGSYGLTGNAGAIDPYKSLSLQTTGGDYQFNHGYTKGLSPAGISNPDLRWEKSLQANIGLDVSLFSDRLDLTIDVYKKTTKDLLYDQSLPFSSGYQTMIANLGGIENKGIELSANARIISSGDFKWNVGANFTANRNKVTDIDGKTQEKFITTYTLLKVGEPVGVFKTYLFDGIYQTGETIIPGSDGRIGGTKVKDYNGDGRITSEDQVITGNPNPKFIYGISTNVSYKNFDLSIFLSGTYGNSIYNVSRASFENPLGQRNLLEGVVDHWTADNPNNEYASPLQGGRLPISDRFVEDGSYLRCKNITLGYRLPTIKGVSSIRVYVSTNNLFTITKYSGYDPEVNTYAGSNTTIGVDNLVYPPAKSFLGGVQVTF
ncbi:SusC/RagA family TonB-linked outer membrane protein [Chryseolinea lacunae]|nr:TonB-dependent receptor [Chryseolinea lacunae]